MGMAPPMGGHGAHGQNAGKGKRAQPEDDALYTERRPWTEGIVGFKSDKRPDKPVAKQPAS